MERAYRFIAVGGKTFYFNIYQTHGGTHNYLTIVAKKGDEQEKLTMFPNQVGSFLHCLLESYAEVCRREGVASPWEAGARVKALPGAAVTATEGTPLEHPRCGKCGEDVYDDRKSQELGYQNGWLNVKQNANATAVLVKCGKCGWKPEASDYSEEGWAIFHRGSEEAAVWEPYIWF